MRWRISAFEKKFDETERSENVVDTVKRSVRDFFYHTLNIQLLSNHTNSLNQKKFVPWFLQFYDSLTLRTDCAIHERQTTARRFDTIFKILWPLSLARSALKVLKFVKIMAQTFLIVRVRVTVVLASIYARKTAVQPFDTIHHISESRGKWELRT